MRMEPPTAADVAADVGMDERDFSCPFCLDILLEPVLLP
eukprot:COSAG05_NODE_22839_length_262_cov_0.619632_1_plen_38_part_10